LAVADEGRRVYIIGGIVGLPTCSYHACVGHDNIPSMLTAEVYELDLGDNPLATGEESTTAHWRQVRHYTNVYQIRRLHILTLEIPKYNSAYSHDFAARLSSSHA